MYVFASKQVISIRCLITKKVSTNFGLIPRSYDTDGDLGVSDTDKDTTQWQRFHHHLNRLNEDCRRDTPNVSYRLVFLGRHGQGYHNVAEDKYGTEEWDVSSPSGPAACGNWALFRVQYRVVLRDSVTGP